MLFQVLNGNTPQSSIVFPMIHISFIFLAILSHTASFLLSPANPTHINKVSRNIGRKIQARRCSALNGRFIEYDESDYYFALNLTRSVSSEEIRLAYKSLTRKFHPDRFSEELRFDPSKMKLTEIRSFLNERKVGSTGIFERAELNQLALETHRKSGEVGKTLQIRREEVTNRFALINSAYNTLYDNTSRRNYDLSGEWGTPNSGKESKPQFRSYDMGDRQRGKEVRERGEARQRDPIQQKVYEKYMKEKAAKEITEALMKKEGKARRDKKREERRRQRERLAKLDEKDLTVEEKQLMKAAANQENIKAMWGNVFNSVLGKSL